MRGNNCIIEFDVRLGVGSRGQLPPSPPLAAPPMFAIYERFFLFLEYVFWSFQCYYLAQISSSTVQVILCYNFSRRSLFIMQALKLNWSNCSLECYSHQEHDHLLKLLCLEISARHFQEWYLHFLESWP